LPEFSAEIPAPKKANRAVVLIDPIAGKTDLGPTGHNIAPGLGRCDPLDVNAERYLALIPLLGNAAVAENP
jgi:hypothetical protein